MNTKSMIGAVLALLGALGIIFGPSLGLTHLGGSMPLVLLAVFAVVSLVGVILVYSSSLSRRKRL